MSADEMFEKLEYEKEKGDLDIQLYKNKNGYGEIIFDLRDKAIRASNDENEAIYFNVKELQAINKKVEELGWNEKRVKIGDRFGRLSVVKELKERSKDGHVVYECKCDCGNTVKVRSKELLNGDTVSCKCYQKEQVKKRYKNGTQPDRIFSDKLNKNNKSGIKRSLF